jgi:hypothetical protein
MLGKATLLANMRVVSATSLRFVITKALATNSAYLPANTSYVPLPRPQLVNDLAKLFIVTSPPYVLGI